MWNDFAFLVLFIPTILPYVINYSKVITNYAKQLNDYMDKLGLCKSVNKNNEEQINKYLLVYKTFVKKNITKAHYFVTRIQWLMKWGLKLFWLHAWIVIQMFKIAELYLRVLFLLPDYMFQFVPTKELMTTFNEPIKLLNAFSEHGCITHKFRLFMTLYWDKGGVDKNYDENSFPREKFREIFGASVLQLSYLIEDMKVNFSNETLNRIKTIFLNMKEVNKHINLDQKILNKCDVMADEDIMSIINDTKNILASMCVNGQSDSQLNNGRHDRQPNNGQLNNSQLNRQSNDDQIDSQHDEVIPVLLHHL